MKGKELQTSRMLVIRSNVIPCLFNLLMACIKNTPYDLKQVTYYVDVCRCRCVEDETGLVVILSVFRTLVLLIFLGFSDLRMRPGCSLKLECKYLLDKHKVFYFIYLLLFF